MGSSGLDAMLLTTEADVRYFTGFLTQFWQSPKRPWFVVVPVEGKPVAVIPEIGPLLSGLNWWTRCMTLILLVFRRFAAFETRAGGQCHAPSQ